YWKWTQRNASGVVKMATSPLRRASIACLKASKPRNLLSATSTSAPTSGSRVRLVRAVLSLYSKTSAMATSLAPPFWTERAFLAAPPPRPPQPIRAILIWLLPWACTAGRATPARADMAVAAWAVVFRNSRREVGGEERERAGVFIGSHAQMTMRHLSTRKAPAASPTEWPG